MTILVTGATGNVGRHLVGQLREADVPVRALSRDPKRAAEILPEGVEIVAGDLADTGSLTAAFEGVTAAHLINFSGYGELLPNGPGIVDAMRRAGIGKVTMLHGWDSGSLERAVMGSADLEWTWIGGGEYMSNALEWAESIRIKREVVAPFGSAYSPMSHEADIAALAAKALLEDGHHTQVYFAAGPAPVSTRDKVRILSEAIGAEIDYVELTAQQAREHMAAEGDPPEMIDFMLGAFGSLPTEPYALEGAITVRRLTGREPRDFAQWARENADSFR